MTLQHCTDLSPAAWITGSDLPWDRLVGFGPAAPAYARLRFIPDPAYPGQSENDVDAGPGGAEAEAAVLRGALDTLARHTGTPDDVYVGLWDGWSSDLEGGGPSGPAPAFARPVLDGPRFAVPNRAFLLFRGRLSDVGDWGAAETWPGHFRTMPPAFVWPADHAWCLANDVDPHWAGIGASTAAVADLLADPRLDAVRANPAEPQPAYV
ncbi:hypothetical protein [Cellulomonas sp. ATA003]|uniref:hypothetical protein n=1 Tax=Cellulomonas sp. ATA003 TaxID=3073064 RepID=UPI002872EA2A|nr:hypothetical protein [Cellulomonas sp. ATA003]WNB87111.1 hypothetical protein REH70_08320 [Cellulomonas sp. ATA003]